MPLMSQASKRGGWLLSTFYRKHYLPPLSYRNQIPTTAPRSWLRAWDSHPRSTQDLSSVYHADFLFLFGASKIFILFLSLALPFCSLSILCQSLSWIWNRGETLKFEQTVLTWLESISWLLNWLFNYWSLLLHTSLLIVHSARESTLLRLSSQFWSLFRSSTPHF